MVAVVPARDEETSIAEALTSLARQTYAGPFEIVVVDDNSADQTASLVAKIADSFAATRKLRLLSAGPPEPGWTGKLWAIQQGVQAASTSSPVYWWFTDADIAHAPDTLQRLVTRAETHGHALTSLMVLLRARTLPERLLIPAFLYFFLKLYPPALIQNPRSRVAGAAGGCILLRNDALQTIGGLQRIRDQVIDDCALAKAVKSSSRSVWLGVTRRSVSLRSYTTFAEIRDLIARTAFTQLHYSTALLFGTIVGMFLTYLVPFAVLFFHDFRAWWLALLACVLMIGSFLPTIRFYLLPPWYAFSIPFAAALYSFATCISAIRFWSGKGGMWKGRAQAQKS